MSGIETAVRVREDFGIPVVFLTVHADEETLSRARKAEPYGYLVKPFQERTLRIGIEMALQQYDLARRIRENEEKFRLLAADGSLRWIKDMLQGQAAVEKRNGPDVG